jgi:Fe-S oxidoreductase
VRLKVKEVAIVECGTAFRVMKYMTGVHPFKVVAFVELISRYLREGRIQLDKGTLKGTLTYTIRARSPGTVASSRSRAT